MIIAAGYAWRFFNPGGIDRHKLRHALSVATFHFFLPALAFSLVASARVDGSFIAVPLTAAVVILTGIAAAFAAYRLLPWFRNVDRPAFGVMVLATSFGNVTYLGLPVITEMLGQDFGYVAILFDMLASTPLLLTAGVFIAARYGSGKAVPLLASIKRVLRLPPLWAVAFGIIVQTTGVQIPGFVMNTVSLMGKAVIPLMTFTVGLALDFRDIRRLPVAVPAIGFKLLIAPVIAWRAGAALGLTEEALKAVTIEGAMPVMVLSLVIADEFELDVSLAALCIAASTAGLFFTLPVIMMALF